MILAGAPGLAHGSAWLTEIWPPLAKLVSNPEPDSRSITVTSWPACAKYHALVTPITPAPNTSTFISLLPSLSRGAAHNVN